MSDFNSSLPIRTEASGDVVVKVVDGTITSQALSIDSAGRVTSKLNDGTGNAVTSQTNGAQRALDVGINVLGVQVDPRAVRALTSADVVTANQGAANTAANGWTVKPTDGTNSQSYTAAGEAKVSITQSIPTGTNTIGSVNQGTSPWITKSQADGPVTPGAVPIYSNLQGAQYNSTLPVLTTGQQAAVQADSSGRLLVGSIASPLPAGTNLLGQVNVSVGSVLVSAANPVPVVMSAGVSGTVVNNYNTVASVASGGTSNHTYTITTTKSFQGKKIHAAASGKLKIEVLTSSDGTTFTTVFVAFNSTATPNIDVDMDQILFIQSAGTGAAVRIIRSNLDKTAQDVYSTISGVEV